MANPQPPRKSMFGPSMGAWKAILILCVFSAVVGIASPAQTFTSLFSFDGTDGDGPAAVLVQGTDGNFYGTTSDGGSSQYSSCAGWLWHSLQSHPGRHAHHNLMTSVRNPTARTAFLQGRRWCKASTATSTAQPSKAVESAMAARSSESLRAAR